MVETSDLDDFLIGADTCVVGKKSVKFENINGLGVGLGSYRVP